MVELPVSQKNIPTRYFFNLNQDDLSENEKMYKDMCDSWLRRYENKRLCASATQCLCRLMLFD